MSNGSSFLWIDVISANFKGSGKRPVLKESFIHLHSTSGSILFPFEILKAISPPDDFVSFHVEITSRTSLVVTGQKEKGDDDYVKNQHNAQKNPRGKRKVIRFPGLRNRPPKIHGRYTLKSGDVMIHTTVQSQSSTWTVP